nr:DDE-type integrase/transposase/recombinase [Piscirickettsia salmonis]
MLFTLGLWSMMIDIIQIKYLNNIIEQDHRPVKKKMNAALGFKSVQGAKATIAGVELYRMLKKNRCTATMIRQHTSNFTCSQLNCVQRKVFLPVNLKLRQNPNLQGERVGEIPEQFRTKARRKHE